MTDRRPKKRQAELPVKKIAIVLALVAGGLLALSYLPLFDSAGQDPAQAPSQGMALPDPVSSDPVNVGAASGALGTQTSSGAAAIPSGNQVARDWQSDAKPLPKKVESETVTTESTNYEGRRVVISDEVVEKLMNQPNVSGALPTAVVDELVGSGSRAVPTGTTAQVKNPAPSRVPARTEAQPASGAQTAPVAAPAAKVALTPVATLNKKPKNHYSIQLMGASNTKAVDSFVAEHGLAGKVWVYKTRFRGSPWYVVVQGDYASSTQAKAAIRKLSPALLKGQPWPKSFAQIQKELKQ